MKYKKFLLYFLIIAISLTVSINETASLENKKTPKVVVVGVDGIGWHILDPAISEGKLPFIRKMISKGMYGTLNSRDPLRSIPIWTSMITGLNSAEHGLVENGGYYKAYFDNNYFALGRYSQINDIKGKKIWEYLNDNDITTTILNLSVTYPVEKINGIMLSGDFAPTFYLSNDKLKTIYPENLRKELIQNVGDYEFQKFNLSFVKKQIDSKFFNFLTLLAGNENMNPWFFDFIRINTWKHILKERGMIYLRTKVKNNKDSDEVANILKNSDSKRAKTFLYLMKNYPTDFTFVYFGTGSYLQYFFYPFPRDNKDYDELTEKYGHLVGEYLEFLDSFLNKIEEIHGENTIIILVSDHGIGPCDEEWCCNDPNICRAKTRHTKDGIFLLYSSRMDDGNGRNVNQVYDIELLPLVLQIYDIEVSKNLSNKIKLLNQDLLKIK